MTFRRLRMVLSRKDTYHTFNIGENNLQQKVVIIILREEDGLLKELTPGTSLNEMRFDLYIALRYSWPPYMNRAFYIILVLSILAIIVASVYIINRKSGPSPYVKERKKEEKYLKNEIRKAVKESSKEKAIQGEINRLSNKRIQIVKLTETLKDYQQAQKELGRLATDENDHAMAVKRLIDVVRRLEDDKKITKESIENAKNEIRPLIPIQKKLESLELDLDQIKNEALFFGNEISSTKTRLELSTAKKKQLEPHAAP